VLNGIKTVLVMTTDGRMRTQTLPRPDCSHAEQD